MALGTADTRMAPIALVKPASSGDGIKSPMEGAFVLMSSFGVTILGEAAVRGSVKIATRSSISTGSTTPLP